ncbi:MAG: hypothetical protein GWN64_07710 [Candidatus Thorarchaeota archaeon]|nr:hypothetical protein [Candidatus Thorarchaeota archaeon]
MAKNERRQHCEAHRNNTDALMKVMFGNGQKGIQERVFKLEVMIWILIGLVLGNGGLLAVTLKTIVHKGG